MMYSQDNDETYPAATAGGGAGSFYLFPPDADGTTPSPTSTRWVVWGASLNSYIKNYDVFQCPSVTKTDPFGLSGLPRHIATGYVYNKLLSWNSQAKVVSPSSIFLVTEAYGNQGYMDVASADYFDVGGGWGPGKPYSFGMGGASTCSVYGGYNGLPAWQFDKIHSGTNNYLYVDGHVKALKAAGDYQTHPLSRLNPDGSMAGYWSCGDGCPCLWIPEYQ